MPELLDEIRTFFKYDADLFERTAPEYIARIDRWRDGLLPSGLHGRMISAVGQWQSRMRDEHDNAGREIADLAMELIADPEALKGELPWLSTEAARMAGVLGQRIGEQDEGLRVLAAIIDAAGTGTNSALARGYVAGALQTRPQDGPTIQAEIDRAEQIFPRVAFDLSLVGGHATKPVERGIRLVRAGRLPSAVLASPGFWSQRLLSTGDHERLIRTVIETTTPEDAWTLSDAVSMAAAWLDKKDPVTLDHGLSDVLWTLIERAVERSINSAWAWAQVLRVLAEQDARRASKLAIAGMLADQTSCQDEAEQILIELAGREPSIVMDELGRAMDSERGWMFYAGKHTIIFSTLPIETVTGWLKTAGVEGARKLARHLPAPFIGGADEPTPEVPALTAFVLQEFEDDDQTFHEFVAGVHSLQLYTGDIAEQHRQEAEHAKRFESHHLRRIREWAKLEQQDRRADAVMWQRFHDERGIE